MAVKHSISHLLSLRENMNVCRKITTLVATCSLVNSGLMIAQTEQPEHELPIAAVIQEAPTINEPALSSTITPEAQQVTPLVGAIHERDPLNPDALLDHGIAHFVPEVAIEQHNAVVIDEPALEPTTIPTVTSEAQPESAPVESESPEAITIEHEVVFSQETVNQEVAPSIITHETVVIDEPVLEPIVPAVTTVTTEAQPEAPAQEQPLTNELIEAVKSFDHERLIDLLEQDIDTNTPGVRGISALTCAAALGNNQGAEILIGHGANVDLVDEYGNTPLHWAAANGQLPLVGLLVSNGADVTHTNRYGNTAFDCARNNNHADIADFFAANYPAAFSTTLKATDQVKAMTSELDEVDFDNEYEEYRDISDIDFDADEDFVSDMNDTDY